MSPGDSVSGTAPLSSTDSAQHLSNEQRCSEEEKGVTQEHALVKHCCSRHGSLWGLQGLFAWPF